FEFPAERANDTVKFSRAHVYLTATPYWDRNENGVFDGDDAWLPTLYNAMDPKGATQPMPLRNQPPKIFFALDPNTQVDVFVQPETTFTAATFSWYSTDEDGDQTVTKYVVALNDTTTPSQQITIPGNIKLLSLVVPRSVSDTATSVVSADVYRGTYITPPVKIGTIGGLKINALNKFFVQAIDVAGDSSHFISMPTGNARWYVKKPRGKLLIIADYIYSDSNTALSFYQSVLPQVGAGQFSEFEVLKISQGLSAEDKKNNRVGRNTPPFYDPALIFTLHLFDVVLWYTDMWPSLSVAQIPLYEYIHNSSHQGKVIYSTLFETSVDPSGALKDFAPIDSVSQVDLVSPTRPLPVYGDSRIPGGYYVYPDSSDPDIFPTLRFSTPPATHNPMYVRPIYKRSDARYIYRLQDDIRNPIRYVYTVTSLDFRAVDAIGDNAWACGVNGIIYHTSDKGLTWQMQAEGNSYTLQSIQMLDANNGWAVGNLGTILTTNNGGTSWANNSIVTIANFQAVHFVSASTGFIVGNYGTIAKTTNGGGGWNSLTSGTQQTLNDVNFLNDSVGIIVGDAGMVLTTSDNGSNWQSIVSSTTRNLYSIDFASSNKAFAVGRQGQVVKLTSTNDGGSWSATQVVSNTSNELRSVSFVNENLGWIFGNGGIILKVSTGAEDTLSAVSSGVSQNLNGSVFTNGTQGWCVGANGLLLRTDNGSATWTTQPHGVLNVGIIDGAKSFVFLSLPLHRLNGNGTVKDFLEHVLFQEFTLP
ncbi:MAG: hypothetical protein EPO24_13070, partial [Bacteroidetes bacterium]